MLEDDRSKTPWRVVCPFHGPVCLSHEEYEAQSNASGHPWCCPLFDRGNPSDPQNTTPGICGAPAEWDEAWYDKWCDEAQGTQPQPKRIEGCLACNQDPAEREQMRNMLEERGIRVEAVPSAGHGNTVVCPGCGQAWIMIPHGKGQLPPS